MKIPANLQTLADTARALVDEWGSDAQIDAENAFADAANALLTQGEKAAWRHYCLKATSAEIIDSGLEFVRNHKVKA